VESLNSGDEAQFIEQEIEARLGIVDAPVIGEYWDGEYIRSAPLTEGNPRTKAHR
jgi:hypothetical protein